MYVFQCAGMLCVSVFMESRPDVGDRSTGAVVTGRCELPNTDAGNQTQVL